MKTQRNLSGIYFRYKNPETGEWEKWCFEDLPVEDQDKQLENRENVWLKSLVKQLAITLNEVAEHCDIAKL